MIIDVPFKYHMTAVPKGKFKERSHEFQDTVPVIIPEVAGSDVDVIAVFSAKNWNGETSFERDYVAHDGVFYTKKWVGERKPEHFTVSASSFHKAASSREYVEDIPTLWNGSWYSYQGVVPTFDPAAMKSISSSDRDAHIEKINAAAARYIFIDDVLYQKSSEPVLIAHVSRGPRRFGDYERWVSVEFLDSTNKSDQGRMWRLDRLENLVAFWESLRSLSDDERQGLLDLNFTVYQPGEIHYDRERVHLDQSVNALIDSAMKRLPEAGRDELVAYADARDAVRSITPGEDPHVGDAIEACRALIAASHRTDADSTIGSFEHWAELWLSDPLRGMDNENMDLGIEHGLPYAR